MLPIITLVLAVSLLVVLARAEVLQPATPLLALDSPTNGDSQGERVLSFSEFKAKYNKHYASMAEEAYRLQVYAENLNRLKKHNANTSRSYSMGCNSFLDIAPNEFKGIYAATYHSNNYSRNISQTILADHTQLRLDRQPHPTQKPGNDQAESSREGEHRQLQETGVKIKLLGVNASLMWSEENSDTSQHISNVNIDWTMYAGSVRHQGHCGACYAFSTADTIAAVNAIQRYGSFMLLSVQQIIDCPNNGLIFGCNGGFLEGAFTYVQINGLTSDLNYPYGSAETGEVSDCKINSGPFRITSFNPMEDGSCLNIVHQLKRAPLSVGISGLNLQLYRSGIFNDCDDMLDHAVVLVGYKSGIGWKIKNSWGIEWGKDGFGWIAEGNTCGICSMAVSVQVLNQLPL